MTAQVLNNHPVKQTRNIRRLVGLLVALTILAISGRVLILKGSGLADQDTLWRLTINAVIDSQRKGARFEFSPPVETKKVQIIEQTLRHSGFRIRYPSSKKDKQRLIQAVASTRGFNEFTAEFILHVKPGGAVPVSSPKTVLDAGQRQQYLADTLELRIRDPMVRSLARKLSGPGHDVDQVTEAALEFSSKLPTSRGRDLGNVPLVLHENTATILDRALTMVSLCRSAGIPARVVTGLLLREDHDGSWYYWVQAYDGERWKAYHPGAPDRGVSPFYYVALAYDRTEPINVVNGELSELDVTVARELAHPFLEKIKPEHLLQVLDLTRLPQEARNDLAIMLLLPFGALVTAICRHLVGVHSYGVFTPTLLALALVYMNIVSTLAIFLLICLLAITGRSIFPDTISRIPRLSIIFTMVAIIMGLLVSVLDYFHLQQGDKVILLPMIILTSLIDRLYRTIEDKGPRIAMQRLAWTIIITLLCLPVMQFEQLGHLMVNYPEAHFATLAVFLLISTYKGKQLMNLGVFKLLAEPRGMDKEKQVE